MTTTAPYKSLLLSALTGLLLVLAVLAGQPQDATAQPSVGTVDASWEDSLAVILPEVLDPISPSLRQTLRSGVPLIIELELRFARTGFVRTETVPVKVEYDVWTGWYRVHTPLSPLAIEQYSTLERLFERDMALIFDTSQIDPDEDWYVKVRVGTRMDDNDGDEGQRSGVEDDLPGITRFLFSLFGRKHEMSEWSELVKLPRRSGP